MSKKNNLITFPSASAVETLKRIMASAEPATSQGAGTTQQILECMLRIESLLKNQATMFIHNILRFG